MAFKEGGGRDRQVFLSVLYCATCIECLAPRMREFPLVNFASLCPVRFNILIHRVLDRARRDRWGSSLAELL